MNRKKYQTPTVVDLQAVTDMPIAEATMPIGGSDDQQWAKERADRVGAPNMGMDDENANAGTDNGYGSLW